MVVRPRTLEDFVGQRRAVEQIRVFLDAARARGTQPEHVLLLGPPGTGKTSLARIISHELETDLVLATGTAFEKPADVIGALSSLRAGQVLFVDELHRVPSNLEEILYVAMEDFRVDVTVGDRLNARLVQVPLDRFTLVGATTDPSALSKALRDRFGLVIQLDPYTLEDLAEIVARSAERLQVNLSADGARFLASRARGTPRRAVWLAARWHDWVCAERAEAGETDELDRMCRVFRVDRLGLESAHRQLLRALRDHFDGGPAGVLAWGSVSGIPAQVIESVYEPDLLQSGLVSRTSRGRVLTDKGREHVEDPWS